MGPTSPWLRAAFDPSRQGLAHVFVAGESAPHEAFGIEHVHLPIDEEEEVVRVLPQCDSMGGGGAVG